MDMHNLNSWISFSKDWNNGVSVKDMAVKYGCEEATIRNWVAMLRKKGVKLVSRQRGGYDIDVKAINRSLL